MAIWYEVLKTSASMNDFMECNWCFHDFSIERMTYYPARHMIELFMKYDELEGSVFLRFINIKGFHFPMRDDCLDIQEAKLRILPYGGFLLICDEEYDDVEKNKAVCDWFECDRILWAVSNKSGEPAEMPYDKIDQVWSNWGKEEKNILS